MQRFVSDFLPRQVMLVKYGVLIAFDEQGFNFQNILRDQGLEEFIRTREQIYPHLIKVFYSNLYVEHEFEKIRSEIKKVRFSLNHEEFGKAFNVPCEILRLGSELASPWEETKEEIFASLCKPSYKKKKDSKFLMHSGSMTVENRLLHYFLAY